MHHTQDIILTIGSLIFVIALIPSIKGTDKPAVSTSFITLTVLMVFSAVYVSLDLLFSAVTTLASAVCWLILAVQKLRQVK